MISYPEARQDEIIEVVGGVLFEDPFRWLEEDSEESLTWQDLQNRLADQHLRDWPGFDRLTAVVARLIAPLAVAAPRQCAGKWFSLVHESGRSCLEVAERLGGPAQLFDLTPPDPSTGSACGTVDWWQPSPDGRFVAYGVSEGGGAQGGIQLSRVSILELAGKLTAERPIAHVVNDALAWLPDSTGFYYVAGLAHAAQSAERRLYLRRLGESGPDRCEPLRGLSYCAPQLSPDGRYLAVVRGSREPRADLILDRSGSDGWRLFLANVPAACFGFFLGNSYLAITTLGADRGRVVAIPIATAADSRSWREIVPPSDGVLRHHCLVGEKLVVCDLVDAGARIRVFTLDGRLDATVQLPGGGAVGPAASWTWWHYVGMPMVNAGDQTIAFVHSTFCRSPVPYVYDLDSRELTPLATLSVELADVAAERTEVPADDGARIPIRLVYRRDLDRRRPHPTVIFAYGGYNHAFVPAYLAMFAALVEAGGVLAFSHIRGGGEYGLDWWRAGHHEHKQRSFDDLYAIAEWLIGEGSTTSGQLALVGASNGGMNVAVAVTQRPELFKAAVALVPQCDLLRYSRDPFYGGEPIEGHHNGIHVHGGTWRNPQWAGTWQRGAGRYSPAHFPDSVYPDPFSYSPYYAVRKGVSYPATLIVSAGEDLWCPPWHGRKLAARLQAETDGPGPILLRVWPGEGHDVPLLGTPVQVAEWVGFLLRQLSLA